MTGNELITFVRIILRDTGRGVATTARMYSDDDIISSLYDARASLCRAMIEARSISEIGNVVKMRQPFYPRFSLTKLLKTVVVAATAQSVPDDFWKLEGGEVVSTGQYVQIEEAFVADSLQGAYATYLYTRNGKFYATPTPITAYYWALPQTAFAATDVLLTDFPNGMYYTMAYLAARSLLMLERADSLARFQYAEEQFNDRLSSLQ